MKPKFFAILLFTFSLAFFGASCSKSSSSQDRVINVESDDAEMNAAIEIARSLLPQFWKTFDEKKSGEQDFALKVKVVDGDQVEHFWAVDIERSAGQITGTINNDPEYVKTIKMGQRITIPEADISDWLYMRDGKMVGNYTLVPMFKNMSPEDVAAFKKLMAEP